MRAALPFEAFKNRYAKTEIFTRQQAKEVDRFFNSAAGFVASQILSGMISGYEAVRYDRVNEAIAGAHEMATTELGLRGLFVMRNALLEWQSCYIDDAANYLANGRADPLERLTFLEFLLLHCCHDFQNQWDAVETRINGFLKASGLRLTYRDLTFLPVEDERLMDEVTEPFWKLVEDRQWANVRKDMEEAFRQRDIGGPNVALLAARAFESAIKIVSDRRGYTHGKERGAAMYIDNLVAKDRFIDVWESNLFKRFFAEVRNPEAHGAGSASQPALSDHQTAWALEFCMISIKSLIRRL